MNDKEAIANQLKALDVDLMPWYRRKFITMIALAVVFAVLLTSVSLYLYGVSTASQLDLSRPGYESVRAEIEKDDVKDFSSTGVITSDIVDQFDTSYKEQVTKTKSNQFSSNALSDEALGLPGITR